MVTEHFPVVVVGGGQAGLSVSACLTQNDIAHVVLEKHRIAHAWRTERWDSFCLVTPNWQCGLPGFGYAGADPHGFMPRDEIVAYIEAFARRIDAPVREGVAVSRVSPGDTGGFLVQTSNGAIRTDTVVLAISAYHTPNIPHLSARVPAHIAQIHSCAYRNAAQLPHGDVLVVGTGQSGCQIAEDLHLLGRKVHLIVGSAPRSPRVYRGRDAVDWLHDLGQYDLPIERHPLGEQVRRRSNHYMTGRDGGRDIDLRRFALEGMALYGRLLEIAEGKLRLGDDLTRNLDNADASYNGICTLIDNHVAASGIDAPAGEHYRPVWSPTHQDFELDLDGAGIKSIVWATGFRSDWSWIDVPFLDATGYPTHRRGVTTVPGLYVVGLPWLHTWGSGRFAGIARDAGYLAEHIASRRTEATRAPTEWRSAG